MRFRYLLSALALTAGSAFSQQGVQVPNAIGVWNSNGFINNGWYYGTLYPAGTLGFDAFQSIPPELTTYYRSQFAGGTRQLSFRGFEMQIFYGFFGVQTAYNSPHIQIRDAVQNTLVTTTVRWLPGPNLYADFASIPNLIPGNLPPVPRVVFGADLGVGNAALVPAGSPTGGALTMVWKDWQSQYGDGFDLFTTSSATEPNAGTPAQTISYSGIQTPTGPLVLPNPGFSGEYSWTWLFENSLIQPVRNSKLISAAGLILGGAVNPTAFAFQMDDGRGGINPGTGDAISYNGNSKEGTPLPGPVLGTTWFAPFVLLNGYLTGGDPPAEPWLTGAFEANNTPVRKWTDDFCAISFACPSPGTGAVLNPANSTYGMWMGLNLPTFIDITVLLNNLQFADISSGPLWAGPSTLGYNSTINPTGLLGRNLISFVGSNTWTATGSPIVTTFEHRGLINPQAGYSPIVPVVGGPTGTLGFGAHPGPSFAGGYVGIQCWMLSTITNTVVDVTNVGVARL